MTESTQQINARYGTAMENALRLERILPGPIERVWAYLTESDKRVQWLAGGEMDLKVGGKIGLNFKHDTLTEHDEPTPDAFKSEPDCVDIHGEILQYDPPNLLSYTWEYGEETTEVTFKLKAEGDNVRLLLTHTNITKQGDQVCIAAGWHTHIGILVDKLNNEKPGPFWKTFEEMRAVYEGMIGAK